MSKIKKWLLGIVIGWLTPENVSTIVATGVARLLEFARGKDEEKWNKAKSVIDQINVWTSLFTQVYEDDKLTEEEEAKIADAIANSTTVEKIIDILSKTENPTAETTTVDTPTETK
jgi:Na+/phosphate symporter